MYVGVRTTINFLKSTLKKIPISLAMVNTKFVDFETNS